MTHPITLRAYQPSDGKICLRIWRAAAEEAHPFLSSAELEDEAKVIVAALRGPVDVTVATIDGTPAGFIALSGDDIAGLFVDPTYQRNGLGGALVRNAIGGGQAASVEVYLKNQRARAFYEHMGFRECARRASDDLGRPFELVRMKRRQEDGPGPSRQSLVLRPARKGDVAEVTDVLRRAWLDAYAQIVPFPIIRAWAGEDWNARHAERHWHEITVAEQDRIVGVVQTERDLLAELFVHPVAQRKGVGSALLQHGVTSICRAGHRRARVQVLRGNERAFSFYAASGWRATGNVEEEWVAGERTFLHELIWDGTASSRTARPSSFEHEA